MDISYKTFFEYLFVVLSTMVYLFLVCIVLVPLLIYYMKDHPAYQEGWKQLSRMLGIDL